MELLVTRGQQVSRQQQVLQLSESGSEASALINRLAWDQNRQIN
jgi:hypothetical protein